jgi:hypothetical protein
MIFDCFGANVLVITSTGPLQRGCKLREIALCRVGVSEVRNSVKTPSISKSILFLVVAFSAVAITVLLCVTAGAGMAGLSRQAQQAPLTIKKEAPDKTSWPVMDYTASQAEDAQRKARGKTHNRSEFRVHPDDPSENTTLVDAIDSNLPALPVIQSNAVLIGDVLNAQAFLSDDRTGVYSEFTIRVSDVIKSALSDLKIGNLIEVDRDGGRVKFPSGKIHWYSVDKENMPKPGRRYVLFVTRQNEALHLLTGYELREGKIFPLDDLPQFVTHTTQDENVIHECR